MQRAKLLKDYEPQGLLSTPAQIIRYFVYPINGRSTRVPRLTGDLPIGTLKQIEKDTNVKLTK